MDIQKLLALTSPLLFVLPAYQAEALTMRDALQRALKQNPDLAASTWEVPAAQALITQAALRPNPEAEFSVDNIGGTGPYGSVNQAEATLKLSQLIEMGGKRRTRITVAQREREIAMRDVELRHLTLLKDTSLAFIEALSLQQQLDIDHENQRLAEEAIPVIQHRVEAGKGSVVEVTRTEIAAATARMEAGRTERSLAIARQKLAALLGEPKPTFSHLEGSLATPGTPPSEAQLLGQLGQNPAMGKADAEIRRRHANLAQEQSKATSDITAFAGPRWIHDSRDITLVAGVSMQLPFGNSNQGAIAEARYRIEQAHDAKRATQLQLTAELAESYQALLQASQELELLENTIVPGAKATVTGVDEGYQAGRLTTLDLLEARRTLSEARSNTLRAQTAYHKAKAEIDALTTCTLIDEGRQSVAITADQPVQTRSSHSHPNKAPKTPKVQKAPNRPIR